MGKAPSRTEPASAVEWFKWLTLETLHAMHRDLLIHGVFDDSADGRWTTAALRSVEVAAASPATAYRAAVAGAFKPAGAPHVNKDIVAARVDLLKRLPAVLDPLHIANECRKQLQEMVDVFEPTPRSYMRMTQGQLSAVKRTKTLITQLEELPKPVYG